MTRTRASAAWAFAITAIAPVHGLARQPRGDDRPARHPARSRLVAPGPRMDGQRLHADLRRPAADRRRARRPVRAATAVRDRPGDLHGRVRGRRAGALEQRAHRRPGRPGPGRRDRHPADPDDPVGRGLAAAACAGARGLGRHRRPGHRRRSARRRGHRTGRELALDLLAQRAGRHRRRGPGLPATSRVAWTRGPARPARAGAGQRRPARAGLGRHPRQRRRLDQSGDRRRLRRRRRPARPVRPVGAPNQQPDAPAPHVPQPRLRGRQHACRC